MAAGKPGMEFSGGKLEVVFTEAAGEPLLLLCIGIGYIDKYKCQGLELMRVIIAYKTMRRN